MSYLNQHACRCRCAEQKTRETAILLVSVCMAVLVLRFDAVEHDQLCLPCRVTVNTSFNPQQTCPRQYCTCCTIAGVVQSIVICNCTFSDLSQQSGGVSCMERQLLWSGLVSGSAGNDDSKNVLLAFVDDFFAHRKSVHEGVWFSWITRIWLAEFTSGRQTKTSTISSPWIARCSARIDQSIN
jgi:hypothetical protein